MTDDAGAQRPGSKAALRAQVRAARRELPEHERTRLDGTLAEVALDARGPLAALPPGSLVAAYRSTPTEPGTRALRAAMAARGLVVVLPVVVGAGAPLAWEVDGGAARAEGLAGVDAVLLPALAVDASGTRLGQGGGHYDRSLAHPAHSTPGLLVAVVRDEELLPAGALPREAHDVAVGAALTPSGWHHLAW